jgi:hypothetical protein
MSELRRLNKSSRGLKSKVQSSCVEVESDKDVLMAQERGELKVKTSICGNVEADFSQPSSSEHVNGIMRTVDVSRTVTTTK